MTDTAIAVDHVAVAQPQKTLEEIVEWSRTLLEIPKLGLSHDAWLAIRRYTGIGASEAAAALGLSEYQTPYKLWEIKTGLCEPDDLSENEHVQAGIRNEDLIAKLFAEAHPEWRVRKDNFIRRHPEYPHVFCNLDRLAERGDRSIPTIVEVKNVERDNGWGEPGTAEVPQHHYIQVQQQLEVFLAQHRIPRTAPAEARLVAYFAGFAMREYIIPRDPEIGEYLCDGLTKLWGHIQRREPPPMIAVSDARMRWPVSLPAKTPATAEILASVEQIKALQERGKTNEAEIERLKAKVAEFMGEAEELVAGGTGKRLATFKNVTSHRLDQKALAAALPDVAARFTKPSTTRTLRLS